MALYEVEVRGESREYFRVEADSPSDAEHLWWSGEAETGYGLEISDVEVTEIREVEL